MEIFWGAHKKFSIGILLLLSLGCGGEVTSKDGSPSQFQSPTVAILSWNANLEGDLAGYRIYYGTTTGQYDRVIDAGFTETPESPLFQVNNLEPGNQYFFTITAYDYSGNESDFSAEQFKTVPDPE